MDRPELEGLAGRTLDEVGHGAPVDLFEVAQDCGFEIRHAAEAAIVGNVIYVDPSQRPERQRWLAGHELSHALLQDAGLSDDEPSVQYLTGALLLPWIDFARDLRQIGCHPFRLKERHHHASHEAIARRIVVLRPSILWVWDFDPAGTENLYKVVSHEWQWPLAEPTPIEWSAMRAALSHRVTCGPVEPVGGIVAWSVVEERYTRVLCLSDGDVLLDAAAE
jgi:hypothetical protein